MRAAYYAWARIAIALAAPADADGKYTQTWATPYDKTTCAQFMTTMTEHQRSLMAADMGTMLYLTEPRFHP